MFSFFKEKKVQKSLSHLAPVWQRLKSPDYENNQIIEGLFLFGKDYIV